MDQDRKHRFSRQIVLPRIGMQGQERLERAKVAVMGCGALGSALAESMVRAGVGMVRLVDRDIVELSNLQRQHLYTEADVEARKPKALAAAARLHEIDSQAQLDPIVADIDARNIEKLIWGMDLVLDGLDNFETRYLVNDACVKMGIPWFYGAVQGTSAMAMPVIPGDGPCFRCVFPEAPAPGTVPTCEMAGVLGTSVSAAAALQATQALRWLTEGEKDPAAFPVRLDRLDLWTGVFQTMKPLRDESCPCCDACEFPWLESSAVSQTRTLCGREAVQVVPAQEMQLDLQELAQRIAHLGDVGDKGQVLEVTEGRCRLVIFQNGRAIVHGTTDHTEARRLVARYIG